MIPYEPVEVKTGLQNHYQPREGLRFPVIHRKAGTRLNNSNLCGRGGGGRPRSLTFFVIHQRLATHVPQLVILQHTFLM